MAGPNITAIPELMGAYAAATTATGAAVSTAGAVDAAANLAVLVPVFGLIGQEFLATFAGAQAAHLGGVAAVAVAHAGTAAATTATAVAVTATDAVGALRFGA